MWTTINYSWYESKCLHEGPGTIGGIPSVRGLSKGFLPAFTGVSEKTMKNSERQGRQAQPGIEPGTSNLPVLRGELLQNW